MVNTPKSKKQQKKAAGQAQHRQMQKDKKRKEKIERKLHFPQAILKRKNNQ